MPDRRAWRQFGAAAVLLPVWGLALVGCSRDAGTGPAEVKWDRYACERCRMVLSDRKHAAQVRIPQQDGRSQVHFFDDIGCALIWLENQPARDMPGVEIWVTDWRSGDWIDARNAYFLGGQVTPMEYGLGAQATPAAGAMDFAAAKGRIFEVDRKYNVHGGQLDEAPGH